MAINACHSSSIAHRDVKLSNILMDKCGRAKLADFGLATTQPIVNSSEVIQGSLPYMAPEIIRGQAVDPRISDMWALGVTLYELAAGKLPWKADDIKNDILNGRIWYPQDMTPEYRAVLQHLLNRDTEARWTCDDLMQHDLFRRQDQRNAYGPMRRAGSLGTGVRPNVVQRKRARMMSGARTPPLTFEIADGLAQLCTP
jgi:serine/threonine protein kinase